MNIREDIRQLKTTAAELRKFGLAVGGVFLALGGLSLLRHKTHYPWFLWPGAVLMLLGLVGPRLLKHIYIVWMSGSFALGFVMAHIILTLFYFLVMTPIGLAARVMGWDFLSRKLDRQAKTYWISRPPRAVPPSNYERQF